MVRDPQAFLSDARDAVDSIIEFTHGKKFDGGADVWLRLQPAFDLAQAMKTAGRI